MPGCKVGDVAYHNRDAVRHYSGLYGKVVQILERKDGPDGKAWLVNPALHADVKEGLITYKGDWVYDKYLNPIRDQPGEDEMLRIVGKPKEIENARITTGSTTTID